MLLRRISAGGTSEYKYAVIDISFNNFVGVPE